MFKCSLSCLPYREITKISNQFCTCRTTHRPSSPSQRREDATTALVYLGTYEYAGTYNYSSKRAVVFTFLLQHTDGKINYYRPGSQMT